MRPGSMATRLAKTKAPTTARALEREQNAPPLQPREPGPNVPPH